MIKIDGSYLEGGGQIIRTAVALSTLTGKPIRIDKIRKGRSKPGLKPQHLQSIMALKELCSADVEGAEIGSSSMTYSPGKLDFHNMNIDIGTAGSITLLVQAILPVVMFSDKKLTIKIRGGTDVTHSPSVDYLVNVFLPYLRRYAHIEAMIEKRGYYPKGGGRLILKIEPKFSVNGYKEFDDLLEELSERPFDLVDKGNLVIIKGVSHASKDLMKANVAERQARSARFLLSRMEAPSQIDVRYADTLSTGSGITLWAQYSLDADKPVIIGSDALGERGKKSEKVGEEAASELLRQIDSGKPVDCHLADQLVPYLALSGGMIDATEITDHTKTNIFVVKKFLKRKIRIKGTSIFGEKA